MTLDAGNATTIPVAYLGPEGTFCEQAAERFFTRSGVVLVPGSTVGNVFALVREGRAVYGVVPLENSLHGSERTTLDLLLSSSLKVCGEVDIRVVQNLIVKPGMEAGDIKLVVSHPQALAQCRGFLEKHFPGVEQREMSSTARAVEMLGELKDAAAIGTDIAAKRYGMTVLSRDIEDDPNNFTRFFVLGHEDASPSGRDKTSLVFSVRDDPGALYRALEAFARRGINLAKVESRPERGKPWRYVFYLDFEGHRSEAKSVEALNEMGVRCLFMKVLGSYPRASDNLG
jgi:chorismate mutase/prephenate dehydratase